jgi:hypothetical protein
VALAHSQIRSRPDPVDAQQLGGAGAEHGDRLAGGGGVEELAAVDGGLGHRGQAQAGGGHGERVSFDRGDQRAAVGAHAPDGAGVLDGADAGQPGDAARRCHG